MDIWTIEMHVYESYESFEDFYLSLVSFLRNPKNKKDVNKLARQLNVYPNWCRVAAAIITYLIPHIPIDTLQAGYN